MIQRILDFPGYLICFPSRRVPSRVVLLLHGFPAARGTKNLDLAYWIHEATDASVYILHYKGLGDSPGKFRYSHSIEEARRALHCVGSRHPGLPVSLVGHSWGGMVAMNLAVDGASLLDQVILLSPLSEMRPEDALFRWIVSGVRDEVEGIFGDQSEAELTRDLQFVYDHNNPPRVVSRIPPAVRVTFIQAQKDEVTPPERAKALLPNFSSPPNYLELPLDHSFSEDRKLLAETVLHFL